MSCNLHPMKLHLVVLDVAERTTSDGGIIIPESAKEKPGRGEVVAVPADSQLQVGDFVLYGKYAGHEAEDGDTTYRILDEEDVLARVGPHKGER